MIDSELKTNTDKQISIIEINEILNLIPHRYPLLLVDKIVDFELGKVITGLKNITFNEPYFQGHFPGNPVMPGVLIIEAMAQTSAILVAKTINAPKDKSTIYFMAINDAKFRKIVKPGDVLIIKSELQQNRNSVWKFYAKAYVNDELVAESSFSAMVKVN